MAQVFRSLPMVLLAGRLQWRRMHRWCLARLEVGYRKQRDHKAIPLLSGACTRNKVAPLHAPWHSLVWLPLAIALVACNIVPNGQATAPKLLIQQASHARLTYVAIGASDTFGTGTDDPSSQSWPSDLADKLGNGVRLINLGIPGMHAHDALNAELPVALDTHPDLITIWLAVNDLADHVTLDSYSHDLDLLLSRVQSALPDVRIMVANVPDVTLLPHFKQYDPQLLHSQINAYNTAIADIVQRHHGWLVDLYQRWGELASHPEYISDDGFHPNALGYTRIAEIFDQVLLQNGGV